jgi:hypothetical protein
MNKPLRRETSLPYGPWGTDYRVACLFCGEQSNHPQYCSRGCKEAYEKDIYQMECPEQEFFSCKMQMTHPEMLRHYVCNHPKYHATDGEAIKVIFEAERKRRYGR